MKVARKHHVMFGPRLGILPMTSMIDVVFLLLIFFMVTVSATPPEADLASGLQQESDKTGASSDFQPQIIHVSREGDSVVYRLGSHSLTTRGELLRLLRELPKESGVVVRVGNSVPVESAAEVLQTCKDAGFTKVSYVPAS